MSIQSKAGTIILDAVLTELGRKRIAQGNFKITRFSLGDDEVDYSVSYDDAGTYKILTSSTAPVFEAFSSELATINYGLSTIEREDLMYLPVVKFNQLLKGNVQKYYKDQNVHAIYLSVNEETSTKLKRAFGDGVYLMEEGKFERNRIFVESGIDDPDNILDRTPASREAFILNPGLLDNSFYVYADYRFITAVWGPSTSCFFTNLDSGKVDMNFTALERSAPISHPQYLRHYYAHVVRGIDNLVFYRSTASSSDYMTVSVLRGPRGSAAAIGLGVDTMLKVGSDGTTNYKFSTYGTTNDDFFGDGNKYDYIDTAIYVEGATTGAKLTIPIRIIRYAGT